MANVTTPQVVRSYLAQLEKALADVPVEVREEIVAGVAEELSGLDSATAAARIELLGDPEFIAAEARAEASDTANSSTAEAPSREPGWYPVLAALLVAFGGIVVPIVGWVVGLSIVCLSKTWTRLEKVIAVVTPILAVAAILLITTLGRLFPTEDGVGSGVPDPNPLMPAPYDLLWSGVLLFGGVNVVVGIWLLWRARRAWAVPAAPTVTAAIAAPQASWYPVVTVLLIIGGGYLVPFVGWVVGVTMLWLGDRWSTRDKWIGTLCGPLASVVVLGTSAAIQFGSPTGLVGWHTAILGVLVAPLIANLVVGIRLLRRIGATTT